MMCQCTPEIEFAAAERYARMVEVRLARGEFAAAHAAVARAEREYLESLDPRAARRGHAAKNLSETGLDERTLAALERAGILTLGQLAEFDDRDLLALRGFGPYTVERLRLHLQAWGCYTAGE